MHGGSAVLRPLVDAGAVELLGGPLTHPILPLLPEPVAAFALRTGLDDAALRVGRRPPGIWAPECAWAPGLEQVYAAAGVGHFVVDEPTMRAAGATTYRPWRVGDSDVVAFARDLALTDLVWSSRSGFPGGPDYRDFHDVHPSGLRPSRVTDPHDPHKQPYRPEAAAAAVRRDAATFVGAVRDRLVALAEHDPGGPAPVAVVAWDTELFGHWWHEGPQFLEQVLRTLPAGGGAHGDPGAGRGAGHRLGRAAGRVVGRGQGPPAVGGSGGGRPGGGCAHRRRPDAARRTPVSRRPGRPGVRTSTTWSARACSPSPATGRSWSPGTAPPGTRATGTPPTRPASTPSPTPSRAGVRSPGPSPDGALASHLDARMLVAARP